MTADDATVQTDKQALRDYVRKEKLGEGTYGVVYKCLHKKSNMYVALKKIKIDINEEGIPATTLREISLLRDLKHPCIITLMSSLYVEGDLFLVFEHMDSDLKQYLDALSGFLDLHTIKSFAFSLIEGVRFCHSHRVLHRDLKPQNILISRGGQLKIADFGLGREHFLPITKLTHEVVTLWYRPPEILLGSPTYSGACDVWGIATIIAEIGTRRALFAGDSEIDQLFEIFRVLGTPTDREWNGVSNLPEYSSEFPKWRARDLTTEHPLLQRCNMDRQGIELIASMLRYDPCERITCKQALAHPWFHDVRSTMLERIRNEQMSIIAKAEATEAKKKAQILARVSKMGGIKHGRYQPQRRGSNDENMGMYSNEDSKGRVTYGRNLSSESAFPTSSSNTSHKTPMDTELD